MSTCGLQTQTPDMEMATVGSKVSGIPEAEIVKIVQDLKTTERSSSGLNALYDFTLKYPSFDITPHIKINSSFYEFVMAGLQKVKNSRSSRGNSKVINSR